MLNTATVTANGYPLTGYPMRPAPGPTLTSSNVLRLVRQIEAAGWLVQPKVNGDRVLLAKLDGVVTAWNRIGSRYSFTVNAVADWTGLPDDSLLDGEGWQGRFYPFEALRIEGQDLTGSCVSIRAARARELCQTTGNKFLFDRPADAWLKLCGENLPTWEGIVAKKLGEIYRPVRKAHFTSATTIKAKW